MRQLYLEWTNIQRFRQLYPTATDPARLRQHRNPDTYRASATTSFHHHIEMWIIRVERHDILGEWRLHLHTSRFQRLFPSGHAPSHHTSNPCCNHHGQRLHPSVRVHHTHSHGRRELSVVHGSSSRQHCRFSHGDHDLHGNRHAKRVCERACHHHRFCGSLYPRPRY